MYQKKTCVIKIKMYKYHNRRSMYDQVQLPTYHPIPVKDTGKNRTIFDKFGVYIVVDIYGLSI